MNILNSRTSFIILATMQAMLGVLAIVMNEWHEAVPWFIGMLTAIKVCTLLPR